MDSFSHPHRLFDTGHGLILNLWHPAILDPGLISYFGDEMTFYVANQTRDHSTHDDLYDLFDLPSANGTSGFLFPKTLRARIAGNLVSESAVNEAGVLLALAAEHAQARHHTTLHLGQRVWHG